MAAVPRHPPVGQMSVKQAFDSKSASEQIYAHYLSRLGEKSLQKPFAPNMCLLLRAAWHGARVILRQVSPESTLIFDLILELYSVCHGEWESLASRTSVSLEDLDLFLEYAAVFLGNIGNYYVRTGILLVSD